MMVPGFVRVVASMVLLLLASATTPLVGAAYNASAISSEIDQPCALELAACADDDTCATCSTSGETINVMHACTEDVAADNVDTSTEFCSRFMAGVCCVYKASDTECLQNVEFINFWMCIIGSAGCLEDGLSCEDDGGSVGLSSGSAATVSLASTAAITCAFFVRFLSL